VTGRLIRCTVRTPERERCDCPIVWDRELRTWRHAPELETGAGTVMPGTTLAERAAFHRKHIDTCLHMPRVPEGVPWPPQSSVRERRRAEQGRWVKSRV
jgi:hypothetical protein